MPELRVDRAFVDEACDTSAIAKAAALAAQEVGNARQALDLLRVGAELAEQHGEALVTDAHVRTARELHLIEVAVAETMKAIRTSSGRLS